MSGLKTPVPDESHFPVVVTPDTEPPNETAVLFSQTKMVSGIPASTKAADVNSISIVSDSAKQDPKLVEIKTNSTLPELKSAAEGR